MSNYAKWFGGAIGWAFWGPIGAAIGFVIGSVIDSASVTVYKGNSFDNTGFGQRQKTTAGDFAASLMVLSAAVMKSDGKTMKSELEFVRAFLEANFGKEVANEQIKLLGELLKKEIPLQEVCVQIRTNMPISARLQLLHYLFGISKADGDVNNHEINVIEQIANYLNISKSDSDSIKAMYYRDTTSDYRILEVEPSCTDDELKKAYRRMAMKYHPDKVAGMGESVEKSAHDKFRKVQEAYENIKKKRGIN